MNTNELQFSELIDWLEGRLSEEEHQQVENKLDSADEATLANLAWLRGFLEASKASQAGAPPSEVREQLMENFRKYTRSQPAAGPLQRIFATLTFDSSARLAPAGIRSATVEGDRRQFIYDTRFAEIALNIQADPQAQLLSLIGQIFPRTDFPAEGITVQVTDTEGVREWGLATTDEFGEFVLESLPEGRYRVFILSNNFEIILPSVHCSLNT